MQTAKNVFFLCKKLITEVVIKNIKRQNEIFSEFLFQEFVYSSLSTSGFPKSVVLLKNLMKFVFV